MLLGGMEFPLWLLLGVPALFLAYKYSTRTFNKFKKAGIPGPTPYPVIGTGLSIMGQSLMDADMKMKQKYGKFVGMFEGTLPVLMVYDGPWLKEAFIKNFDTFVSRRVFTLGSAMDEGLFSIGGDHWKSARKMLSPEFSSGKLKKMMTSIQKCDDRFIQVLRETNGEPVDISRKSNLLTLDVISQTAFGFDAEAQIKEDNLFVQHAFAMLGREEGGRSTWKETIRRTVVVMLILVAPSWLIQIVSKVLNVGFIDQPANEYFESLSNKIIEERRHGDTTSTDFLQTLANSVVEAKKDDSGTLIDEHGNPWTRKGLTRREVVGNAILFLFAGFQTTADTMFFLFYELAMHPDIQQRLYEEIKSVCDTEALTPEQVTELKYLDRCMNEAMRIYPQAVRFDRVAAEDITVDNVFIEKGTAVTAAPWTMHRDPEIWENPDDYDPDRFLPERMTEEMTASFMPFGLGNRKCIANRLATLEMKMTFINVLKAFVIEKNTQTPARPLKFKASLNVSPTEKIMVSFVERR